PGLSRGRRSRPHQPARDRRRPGEPQPVPLREYPREPRPFGPHLPLRRPTRGRGGFGMKKALAALHLLGLAACATSAAFRAGERAERSEDYDRAVLQYSKAL